MKGFGGARRILEDLRSARVLVVHPNDEDGTVLVEHLRRLGCEVRAIWPLPIALPGNFDTLFIQLDEQPLPESLSAAIEGRSPAIIAIVTYESPTSLKAIVDINAHGVISKPLRALGILTQFALARHRCSYERRLSSKVQKLEETLKGRRVVDKAIKLLVNLQKIDEETAYKFLRDQATANRVTLISIAENIIAAQETMARLGISLSAPQGQNGK
jgi:two-component system, response regulator PdtaR